jgi:hypothetical protein
MCRTAILQSKCKSEKLTAFLKTASSRIPLYYDSSLNPCAPVFVPYESEGSSHPATKGEQPNLEMVVGRRSSPRTQVTEQLVTPMTPMIHRNERVVDENIQEIEGARRTMIKLLQLEKLQNTLQEVKDERAKGMSIVRTQRLTDQLEEDEKLHGLNKELDSLSVALAQCPKGSVDKEKLGDAKKRLKQGLQGYDTVERCHANFLSAKSGDGGGTGGGEIPKAGLPALEGVTDVSERLQSHGQVVAGAADVTKGRANVGRCNARCSSATPSWTGLTVRKADSAVIVDRSPNINKHGGSSSSKRRKKGQKPQTQGLAKDSAGKAKPT